MSAITTKALGRARRHAMPSPIRTIPSALALHQICHIWLAGLAKPSRLTADRELELLPLENGPLTLPRRQFIFYAIILRPPALSNDAARAGGVSPNGTWLDEKRIVYTMYPGIL